MKQQHTLQPKLRFPEFEGDWINKTIKEIALKITDGTHDTPKTISHGKMYITAIHVKDGFIDYENCYYINDIDFQKIISRADPEKGDLLMVNIGAGTATSALINQNIKFGLKNVALIKPNREIIEPSFFEQIQRMNSKRLKHQLSSGGAQPFLSLNQIGKLKLNIPSLPEQQKIADYLSTVDNKINLLEEKKAQLALYKKAMMQKLFAQEIRFKPSEAEALEAYPEWEEKRLGEVFNSYNGLTGKTKENFGFGKPYIKYTQVFNNSKIDIQNFDFVEINDDDNQNSVEFGDAFFTVSSETPHEVGMSSVLLDKVNDVYLNSFCFGIRPKSKNLNPLYYRYFFRSKNFRKEVVKLAQGSTRYNMSKVEFMKIIIQIPSLPEQQKIADFLSAIDESIEKVTEQINQTQSFKKAMLQQMFV